MGTLRYVDGQDVTAERAEGSVRLRVTLRDDRCLLNGLVKRVFPLSEAGKFLSIQDGAGKEVAILRSLDGVEPETRALLEEELDRRYFTPQIDRIDALRMEAGMWKFAVQTQRGPSEFFVRNWRDSSTEIAAGRWQIHSVDGARFEILDLEALDAKSRKLMDQLL